MITALYDFYTFLMLGLRMKYFRDGIDEDDSWRFNININQ